MRLRRAAVLAALACLLPTLAACGAKGTQLQAGDIVTARQAKQFAHGKLSTIATPVGTLLVRTGDQVTQLAADDTHDLTAQTAPSGTVYLPITWSYDRRTTGTYARYVETSQLPLVDVRSGTDSYRLPTPDPAQGAESFYVLIASGAEHPQLALTFDGVQQTVDLLTGKRHAGRAKALYRLPTRLPRTTDCPNKPTWTETAVSASTCRIRGPLHLPYAGGAWAKPGHTWLVVEVRTALVTYTQAGETLYSGGIYYPHGLSTTYRLGRHKPVVVSRASDGSDLCPVRETGSCDSNAVLIFDAPSAGATLKLSQSYNLVLGNGWGGFTGKKRETETATLLIPLG